MQDEQSRMNKVAWNTKVYQARVIQRGTPKEFAARIMQDPRAPLERYAKYLGDVKGKRVANLLGSFGYRAVALALLGAVVTVVDLSEGQKRYAEELAHEAGVQICYINADVMNIPNEEELERFDLVFMEWGILHYFADLNDFFAVVKRLLRDKGRMVLCDFHPFSSKVGVPPTEGKDYFDASFIQGQVAYAEFLPEEERASLPKVLVRRWTLGEIITAITESGLILRNLEERPNDEYPKMPGSFLVAADKIEIELPPLFRP